MGAIKLPHASGNSISICAPATNPASDLELKLPATIGSAGNILRNSSTAGTLEFTNGGITNYDEWWYTASTELNNNSALDLTANFSRQTAPSVIGSAMTESSGVFTFPSTGIWTISCIGNMYRTGGGRKAVGWYIKYTANDGTSWATQASAFDNIYHSGSDATYICPRCETTLDITDTSNQKVKFTTFADNSGVYLSGTASYDSVSFRFTKIGET